jgi:fructose transport system substrate-binding protein
MLQLGVIGATSQQSPLKMASLGVQAIYDLITKGTKPKVTPGPTPSNTGVTLITDDPQAGVPKPKECLPESPTLGVKKYFD